MFFLDSRSGYATLSDILSGHLQVVVATPTQVVLTSVMSFTAAVGLCQSPFTVCQADDKNGGELVARFQLRASPIVRLSKLGHAYVV